MCVCVRACVRMCVYVHMYVGASVRACVRACMCACVHVCMHMHVCVWVCVCERACLRACVCRVTSYSANVSYPWAPITYAYAPREINAATTPTAKYCLDAYPCSHLFAQHGNTLSQCIRASI